MGVEKAKGKITEQEKILWRSIRDYARGIQADCGEDFNQQETEERLKHARKQIRKGAPLKEVWDEISGIPGLEKGCQINLWRDVVYLFIFTPIDDGKRIRFDEYASSLTWKPEWTVVPKDLAISRNTHLWDLSERTQIAAYLSLYHGYELNDMLPEAVYRPLMELNDMMLSRAYDGVGTNDLREAMKWRSLIVEHNSDNNDIDILDMLITDLKKRGNQTNFEMQSTVYGSGKQDMFSAPQKPVHREAPKINRNAPCPCGSGLKYKHCCGKNA